MNTVQWFMGGVIIAAYLVCWRYMSGIVAWNEMASYESEPGGDDLFWGVLVGFFMAPLTPAALVHRALRGRGVSVAELATRATRRALFTPAEHMRRNL